MDERAVAPDPHDYLPLVASIARTMTRSLHSAVELNELINDGVVGLMDAVRRYDADRGVAFATYASHRIRGAMLDGLRRRDPLPRSLRRAQRARWPPGARAAEPRPGVSPNRRARDVGLEPAVHLVDLAQALAVPADEDDGPEIRAVAADLRRHLCRGLRRLSKRDRDVLRMRFFEGLPLREVATRLSLSITRIAEIQARGVRRLRWFLTGDPGRPVRGPRGVRQDRASGLSNRRDAPTGTPATSPVLQAE
jgi:RNA polymerase sigma factor for flagellar operon FliA